ncbi:MAG TPA: penicillin-binding protein 2 [Nocardioidaceae bacterium]|nr:penicillin-binding protein 2 [Nocardioidaceae bacterium]
MNKPIRVLAVGCALLFGALLLNANYVQFVRADELNDMPENRRVIDAEYARERGPIFVAGEAVAESKPVDDRFEFLRTYGPRPRVYSHITGYYSYLYGASGIEQTENDILSGSDPRLLFNRVIDLVTEEQPKGGNVLLTLDPAAQAAAHHGLTALPEQAKGAVVALRPDTGEVLAMVSMPDYDPNVLASHDFAATADAWKRLTSNPAEPLVNRAIQQRYPPGSTFKLVTAAAALSSGQYTPESLVTGQATYTLPNTNIELGNAGRGSCGGEQITLTRALAFSCNTSFAKLGAEDLGAEALRNQAQAFGFGQDVFDGLPNSVISVFPEDPDDPQTALSAIGQFEVAATPLQMAMVVAGIANDGTVMQPFIVAEERSPDLNTLEETEPEALSEAVSPSVAADLRQMMVEVTQSGTGGVAAIPGIEVGSKTGTAESGGGRDPYAWFVSFAPADDPEVAVAVFVEDANVPASEISGGGLAGPIAKSVMEAVITP